MNKYYSKLNALDDNQVINRNEYNKTDTNKWDIALGNWFHITPTWKIFKEWKVVTYKNGNNTEKWLAQANWYYLVKSLLSSKKGFWKRFFIDNNKNWNSIKKSKLIINKCCWEIIWTNADLEYYWIWWN